MVEEEFEEVEVVVAASGSSAAAVGTTAKSTMHNASTTKVFVERMATPTVGVHSAPDMPFSGRRP
jgi:hypothetical protein